MQVKLHWTTIQHNHQTMRNESSNHSLVVVVTPKSTHEDLELLVKQKSKELAKRDGATVLAVALDTVEMW